VKDEDWNRIVERLDTLTAWHRANATVLGALIGALQGAGRLPEPLPESIFAIAGAALPAESAEEGERAIELMREMAELVAPSIRQA